MLVFESLTRGILWADIFNERDKGQEGKFVGIFKNKNTIEKMEYMSSNIFSSFFPYIYQWR